MSETGDICNYVGHGSIKYHVYIIRYIQDLPLLQLAMNGKQQNFVFRLLILSIVSSIVLLSYLEYSSKYHANIPGMNIVYKEPQNNISNPKPKEPQHVNKPKATVGYMFALDYGDQGTSSFVNLVSFLCFVSQISKHIKVVEPFMIGSIIGQDASANWSDEVRLSEVYSYETVNNFAKSKDISQLTPYEIFLKEAPRKLLVAQHICTGLSWCIPCGDERARERGLNFTRRNGFEMVGHVCLNYAQDGTTTLSDIRRQLYRNYTPNEIVVLFIRFGGVNGGSYNPKTVYRLHIKLPKVCYRGYYHSYPFIRSSKRMTGLAEQYVHEHFGGKRYMSTMVRLERTIGQNMLHAKEAPHLVSKCLVNLHKKVIEIKQKFSIEKVFMCLDVGEYGSRFLTNSNFTGYYDKFLSETVEPGMTLSKLDSTFRNITLRDNPGFVAALQKAIAARGEVLVFLADRSNFHISTEEEYNYLHKKRNVFHFSSKLCH